MLASLTSADIGDWLAYYKAKELMACRPDAAAASPDAVEAKLRAAFSRRAKP
jgi:hypothetical protein